MQWIFMLVGLVLGALVGESVTSALLGGLIGLGLGQALRLQQLAAENAGLRRELKGFAERFEHGTTALYERLVKLESGRPATAAPPAPEAPPVAEAVPPELEPEIAPAPESMPDELVWELPELQQATPAPASIEAAPPAAHVPTPPPTPPRRPEPRPAKPREPSPIERGIALAKAWLLGGNTVLRIGVVLLFLGLAFLLRYATEGMEVPVALR
ncbi:DUF2339 domain-containing protein, partial [Pseudomonas sp. GD03985]|nr:DUF2339 domain-containing protein [Pseudomonas sp. GD03985]